MEAALVNSVIFRPAPACPRHARKKLFYCLILWVIGLVAVFSLTSSEQAIGAVSTFTPIGDNPTVPVSLSGFVFYDANHNGQLNNEYAIAGVVIDLYENGNPVPVATTTISDNGQYSFTGLSAGTYSVYNKTAGDWLAVPGNITDVSNNAVTTGLGSASSDNTQIDSVILSAGDQATLYNFAAQYYPIQLLSKRMLTISIKPIPEPGTAVMLGFAAIAFILMATRQRWCKR
jgi:hypothetical protein